MTSSGYAGHPMAVMREWLERVCAELGADPAVLDPTASPLLDLVRDVAHGPSRPGAPLTAFLVGLAAGGAVDRGASPDDVAAAVVDRITAVRALLAVDA